MSNIKSPVNIENRKNLDLRVGDRVRVWQKIQEKGKTRLQPFEGLVLARKHGSEAGASFTVRKIALGIGVERIYPLYSPNIDRIEILKRSKVRRSKIYYLRDKVSKAVRRKLRKNTEVSISSVSESKEAEEVAKAKEEEDKRVAEAEAVEKAKEETPSNGAGDEEAPKDETEENTKSDTIEEEHIQKKDTKPAEEETSSNEAGDEDK